MNKQEISLDQILSKAGVAKSGSEQFDSLRYTGDYNPNCNRYSKDDEYEQINFELDDDPSKIEKQLSQSLEIKEENSFEQVKFLLDSSAANTGKAQFLKGNENDMANTSHCNTSKVHFLRKTSLKASERLKKKLSQKKLNKNLDTSTQKYDAMFDQIFFNSKIIPAAKPENGHLLVTDTTLSSLDLSQSFDNENVSSNGQNTMSSVLSFIKEKFMKMKEKEKQENKQEKQIKKEQNQMEDGTEKHQASEIQKQKKVDEPKINIKIKPKQSPVKKPIVKFTYGEVQHQSSPSKQKSSSKQIIQFNQNYLQRLPIFMRKLRQITNSYPNFFNKSIFTEANCQKYNIELNQCLQQCLKSIKILKNSHLIIHETIKKIRLLKTKMIANLTNNFGKEDKQLLTYFLSEDWASFLQLPEVSQIKPHTIFSQRPFIQFQFISYLNSYQEAIQEQIVRGNVLDHSQSQTIKNYMNSRDTLWAIQKNLRIMSQDLYLYANRSLQVSEHIKQSRMILIKQSKNEPINKSIELNNLAERLLFLAQKKDIFGSSCLGSATLMCLLQYVK